MKFLVFDSVHSIYTRFNLIKLIYIVIHKIDIIIGLS